MPLIMDLLAGRSAMRHVSHNKGGEWHGPCPVCGGNDRFHVWPDQTGGGAAQEAGMPGTWWCRKCDKGGDIIALVQAMDGCDFKDACRRLDIAMKAPARRRLVPPQAKPGWQPQIWKIPDAAWRKQAGKLAKTAHERLMATPYALDYLTGRGLPPEAVARYFLGYLAPEDKAEKGMYRARSAFGLADRVDKSGKPHRSLWIPAGISIPLWFSDAAAADAEALRIRIRRRKGDLRPGDSKYMLLEGSAQIPMALPPEGVSPAMTVWVIVEAELDALAVHHACDGRVGVAAVLTNRGKPDAALHDRLQASPLILVALDFDEAGADGFEFWAKTYRQARRWPVPEGKDPGEAFAAGVDLAAWIDAALPASLVGATVPGRPSTVPVRPCETGDREQESGNRCQETGVGATVPGRPHETVPGRPCETGDGEQESRNRCQETGVGATIPGRPHDYVVALKTGTKFHVTDDEATWAALMAANEPAFSRRELARLAEATGGGDDLTAAMPLMCALKQIFSAYVKDGRSGRHRQASGHAVDYFLAPAPEVA